MQSSADDDATPVNAVARVTAHFDQAAAQALQVAHGLAAIATGMSQGTGPIPDAERYIAVEALCAAADLLATHAADCEQAVAILRGDQPAEDEP